MNNKNNIKQKRVTLLKRIIILIVMAILVGGALFFILKNKPCVHDYELVSGGTPATCSKEGTAYYVCSKCGKEKTESIPIDPTNHKAVITDNTKTQNEEAAAAAGCGEEYNIYGECQYCHEIVVKSTSRKADHQPSDEPETWYVYVDEESHEKCVGYRCTICDEIIESMTEKTTEFHDSELKHYANAQKAIDNGLCSVYENECSCGYEYETKLTHNYDAGTYIVRPTCTSGGSIVYTCQNPNCVDPQNEQELTALGHMFKVGEESCDCCDRVCQRCFETVSATSAHTFKYDADCVDRICTKCNQLIKAKSADHVYADNYTCHDRDCIVCHSPEAKIYATTEHLLEETTSVRQDCTDKSEVYYRHCDICGDDISFKYDKYYTSHDMSNQLSYKAPSCEETGLIINQCTHCAHIEETIISASSHNDVVIQSEHVEPTCTTDGKDVYQCTNCKRTTTKVLPKLGHAYADNFTCHDRQCQRCGETCYHTTEHTYLANSQYCQVCGDSIQLATPEIIYNAVSNRIEAKEQTLNTVFYINDEVFSGSLSSLSLKPNVYTVQARNEDSQYPMRNSEYSNALKIIVMSDSCISAAPHNNGGIKSVTVNVDAISEELPYVINLECFDAEGNAIADSSGKTVIQMKIDQTKSTNTVTWPSVSLSPKTAKIKISLTSSSETVVFYRNYSITVDAK